MIIYFLVTVSGLCLIGTFPFFPMFKKKNNKKKMFAKNKAKQNKTKIKDNNYF